MLERHRPTAKWLICTLGQDADIQALYSGALAAGKHAELRSMREIVEATETPSDERAVIIPSGSIWLMNHLKQMRPNWIGNWYDPPTYFCQRYYAYWGKYLTQRHYTFLPFEELVRRRDWLYSTFAKNDHLFLRPDSGEKQFSGQLVAREHFDAFAAEVRHAEKYSPDLLSIAATPEDIDLELRLVIVSKKVITGSAYRARINGESTRYRVPLESLDDAPDIIAFAEQVLADNPPPLPIAHVLDIALHPHRGPSVLEVGDFTCAGLYASDRAKVALHIANAAETEFAFRFPS